MATISLCVMTSPWSHLKRALTLLEWVEFKNWISADESRKMRQGTVGVRGLFWGYERRCCGGEKWVSSATFNKCREHSRLFMRNKRSNPAIREELYAKDRKRYAEDPKHRRACIDYIGEWRKKNRDKDRANAARHATRKLSQMHPDANERIIGMLYAEAVALTSETGIKHQVDHIIPLAAGGWHHHENMQVLPMRINCQKNDNAFWQTHQFKDWRSVPESLWPLNLAVKYRQILNLSK